MSEKGVTLLPTRISASAADNLAESGASTEEKQAIVEILKGLSEDPVSGIPVPYNDSLGRLRAVWTPDQKWRILFRQSNASLDVMSIERDTEA